MRGNAFFRDFVHVFAANLNLKWRAFFCNHRRMQRLIKIRPRHGDEILNPPRHRPPQIVNDAQHRVAILQRARNHAHGKQVVNLINGDMLALQFFVNTRKPLNAALDARLNAGLFQLIDDDDLHLRQKNFTFFSASIHGLGYLLVTAGIEKAKAQVFQLAANLAHAQPVRDGRVNLQRLFRDLALPVGIEMFQRAHVVQPVRELDQHHTNVVDHRQHHLAQIFRLLLFARGKVNFADLGDALYDVRDLLAKFLANVNDGHRRIFHGIVQQPGRHRDGIHLHLGQHQRHFKRMHQIRLARSAALPFMMLEGIIVGFLDNGEIVLRTALLHAPHQVAELGERKCSGRDLLAQTRHVGL